MTLDETKKVINKAISNGAVMAADGMRVEVVLPWTAEEWLGTMKRADELRHFHQMSGYEDGNLRKYIIEL